MYRRRPLKKSVHIDHSNDAAPIEQPGSDSMSANDKQGRDPLIPSSPSHEAYRVDEDQGDVFHKDEPIALFRDWLALAREKEANDPNAMALATIDEAGMPDVRIVLLKDIDEDGLSFYTNLTSAKGEAL